MNAPLPPDGKESAKPVLLLVTPWYPSCYEPLAGIFVAKQVEACSRRFDVRVVHVQGYLRALQRRLLRRRDEHSEVLNDIAAPKVWATIYHPRKLSALMGDRLMVALLEWRLRRVMRKLRSAPAAVLAWTSWPIGYALWNACRKAGLKAGVLECAGPFAIVLSSKTVRESLKRMFSSDVNILTISPFMTREISRELGLELRNATSLGCVIDEDYFALPLRQIPVPGQKVRILCVGTVIRSKGQDDLIKAAAAMQNRADFEIICAGFGPDLEAFRRLAVDAGVQGFVKFIGSVSEAQKLALYASCDFFVTPTLHDTFGSVIAEAMAAGLPIVSTPNGASEWLVDDSCGYSCTAGDPGSLAEAMLKMIRTHGNFDRKLIRDRVRVLFSPDAHVGRLCKALGISAEKDRANGENAKADPRTVRLREPGVNSGNVAGD